MARHKDAVWGLPKSGDITLNWSHVQVSVMMDIRDELKEIKVRLNSLQWDGYTNRELRGLRRDVKKGKRCHKAHR